MNNNTNTSAVLLNAASALVGVISYFHAAFVPFLLYAPYDRNLNSGDSLGMIWYIVFLNSAVFLVGVMLSFRFWSTLSFWSRIRCSLIIGLCFPVLMLTIGRVIEIGFYPWLMFQALFMVILPTVLIVRLIANRRPRPLR